MTIEQRFFGPICAIVPLVKGMMGTNRRRFQIANVLSAIVGRSPFPDG
ncbi:hypothetical protein ACFX5Q_18040 [Mesorhizobium sp. IMUNJ 23033]